MAETGSRRVLSGVPYALREVLKDDRYARSSLLVAPDGALVVHKESILRLPPGVRVPPLAALLARREADHYERMAGVAGVPDLIARPDPESFLRRWVPGDTVRATPAIPDGFFAALEALLLEVHALGIAYVDLAKEENVLVGEDGRPWLIDFQVSLGSGGAPGPVVRLFQREDRYHLSKMRLRRRPDEATDEDRERVERRGRLGRLHRATVKRAYNLLTRRLVKRWSGAGEGRTGGGV